MPISKITQVVSKRKLAIIQLMQAVRLHTEENDHISALTLAGAAEEILGQMLRKNGKTNAFEDYAVFENGLWDYLLELAATKTAVKKPTPEQIKKGLNRVRNELKHNDSGKNIRVEAIYDYETEEMILRAIRNYHKLYNCLPSDKKLRDWFDFVTM
jgi:hypothetical protein